MSDDREPSTRDLAAALQQQLPRAPRPPAPAPSDVEPDAGTAAAVEPPARERRSTGERAARRRTTTTTADRPGPPVSGRTITIGLTDAALRLLESATASGDLLVREAVVNAVNRSYDDLGRRPRRPAASEGVIPVVASARRRRLGDHGRHKSVRFTAAEHEALTGAARELGMSVSEMVTEALVCAYGSERRE